MKKEPTADAIVARLIPEWGHRLALLLKDKYGVYCEDMEEVPLSAVEDWQEVTI